MTATDVIAWTYGGTAYCPEHKPTPKPYQTRKGGPVYGDDPVQPVLGYQSSEFYDGGLSCDTCGAVIIENDTCPSCDRSLRDAHDDYTYGPAGHVTTVTLCRPHRLATILVRERATDGTVTVYAQEVPYDEPIIDGMRPVEEDGAGALDSILAAFAGTLATFDIVSTEEIGA